MILTQLAAPADRPMQLTPSKTFDEVKEALVQYLETAYKIAHPAVFEERGRMLRGRGVVAQAPFIEATPSFPVARKLAVLEREFADFLPAGLAELVQHGVPVDRFPLYRHQEEALLAAFGASPNLLVATGTGSGKTEAFLLPILADLLAEAQGWTPVSGPQRPGRYDAAAGAWLHSRRHETRTAAVRAIILYPMNALVNDQLSRLRRILARGDSPDWQRRNLGGNLIHFGMYTGLSKPTGSWTDAVRRDRFAAYLKEVEEDWDNLRPDLRETGNWPRPDSPEMLCRWDVQHAPPDILVTNYSMLEYMLVRPIEAPIFTKTREWLEKTPDARLTLVVDEAHTYTGALGTEVAHLIRRLKERLGIAPGSDRFRAIATTASVPQGADDRLRQFTSDLFAEPADRFTLVQVRMPPPNAGRVPRAEALDAFAAFHRGFDIQDPFPAIERLAGDLNLGPVDRTVDPQVALHALLEQSEDVVWVRERTARRATLLDDLAAECWGGLGSPEEREEATAGVLAAGSFARAVALPDTPPLLSMRIHAFFRGISGVWACTDPNCPELPPAERGQRPCGRLYTDARPWCSAACGARVLEVFSCRHCGLLFLGGIPDHTHGSLWPWSDDLSGEREDVGEFRVFGVERPDPHAAAAYRSTRTTLQVKPGEVFARETYEVDEAKENDVIVSHFPGQCPRCKAYRGPGADGREVIEPLRTKGPQSFAAVVENGFRNQPRTTKGEPPNYGRKALLFSDSRQEAAILAANLRRTHDSDLFRQLLYRVLYSCAACNGGGEVVEEGPFIIGQPRETFRRVCGDCGGSGRASIPAPLPFAELRRRTIDLQLSRGINPTGGVVPDFFSRLAAGDPACYEEAERIFNVALRREISESRFSLEPLGLASWRVRLPDSFGTFAPLTEAETHAFVQAVARILATEKALLPPEPYKPWEWPKDLVKDYERPVIIPAAGKNNRAIVPYNLTPYRKLGRYVIAVAAALAREGRLAGEAGAERWVKELHWPLWRALRELKVLQWAGAKIDNEIPQGIRLDSFVLHPVGDTVVRCRACAYLMSEALLGVCVRCGHVTEPVPVRELRNFYRLAAFQALPGSGYDDPFPLRASEHTAQIESEEARNEERWFQDLFHDDQHPDDHRVDVLSVTTTMEMGIDIGSLLCVGLRNVPPAVANYQQRAGRAGRRGSSIATVLTFAQQRSHDQYYFERPPEIVTEPPRVPALYLGNAVIARRHVRSLVLQDFFLAALGGHAGSGLFAAWGTVSEYTVQRRGPALEAHVAKNRSSLLARAGAVVDAAFAQHLEGWVDAVPGEVEDVAGSRDPDESLLEELISAGLLPKYAFPIDVVSLAIPTPHNAMVRGGEFPNGDAMQRDLKIALAEYAPGAEVVRGSFPNTYKYRSVGVYDPFAKHPDYSATGILVECDDCQSVEVLPLGASLPDQCAECHGLNLLPLPYLRPRGFTVDAALPDGGREHYQGDGRERSGYTSPARLLVGQTSFTSGAVAEPYAPGLHTLVRRGELFACNKGPDRRFPGYIICPDCGRSLDPAHPGPHQYPADVPPHSRYGRGPRAGQWCPNRTHFTNQVVLGHKFFSEVILFGVDLPPSMDAPFGEASGRAIWYSLGTLLANAAARVLQINPGELKAGVRPVLRTPGRVHGEVFLYDDVPGGAGYARAVADNLEAILRKALELGGTCLNPSCGGACYHCMYDFRNQQLHPMLDRALGTAVLEFVLEGTEPSLSAATIDACGEALAAYARTGWVVEPALTLEGHRFPVVLRGPGGERVGLWVVHPLSARPTAAERQAVLAEHGVRPAVHTSFDLQRRPFWVMNNLFPA
jgi:ATP-dependent helicase YprA (DUF1998 family)